MADPDSAPKRRRAGPRARPCAVKLKRGDYQLVAPCALPHPPVLAVVQVRAVEPAFVQTKSLPEREWPVTV